MQLDQIPSELKEYSQWICWRYENTGKQKLDKIPYCPIDARLASVSNPSSWTSFSKAVNALHNFHGLGFVLTQNDPFTFIDYDDPFEVAVNGHPKYDDANEIVAKQTEWLHKLNSYTEFSPSGKGLHIIVKASLPVGRRRKAIEVYPHSRYMTMTGQIYNNKPIAFRQLQTTELWETLEGTKDPTHLRQFSSTEKNSDREVYDMALNAANGQKFLMLWNGDIETFYGGDQSRADFALIDILSFYTQNREQIVRLFRMSALGKRDKAKRWDYLHGMITKSFDKLAPEIDISGLMNKTNEILNGANHLDLTIQSEKLTAEPLELKRIQANPVPPELKERAFVLPPGLTGKIADFIYKQAWKPVPEIAVVGALAMMAGFCGRAFNASGTGLNLYLLMLAQTGRGKEAISSGFDKIFSTLSEVMPTIRDFEGPGDLASGQALIRFMGQHQLKSCCSVFNEFGLILKRISASNASSADLMTQKVMLHLYTKSGRAGVINPTVYSNSEQNTQTIFAPAFSMVGESAPDWFYDNVNEDMIRSGLLPRFIIVEYLGKRVKSNYNGPNVQPSQELVSEICGLATQSLQYITQNIAYDIPMDADAQRLYYESDKKCDNRINEASDNPSVVELWNRAHLNIIRIAGLLAVGKNPYAPVIDKECWEWSENFIETNITILEAKFNSSQLVIGGCKENKQIIEAERVICDYLIRDAADLAGYGIDSRLHQFRVIPYSYLSKRLYRNKSFGDDRLTPSATLKRAIVYLIENGDLEEISKRQAIQELNTHGRCFVVRSERLLERVKRRALEAIQETDIPRV